MKTCTGWLCIASAHIMSAQRASQKPLAAQNPSHGGGIQTWHRIPQRYGIPTAHRAHQRQRPSVCSSMYRRRTSRTRSKRERPSTSAQGLPRSRTGAVERWSVAAESESATGESGWRGQPVPAQMWRTCDDRVKDALLEGDHHIEVLHARRPPASRPARGELNSARQRRSGSADGARPAASAVAAVLRRRRVRTSAFG